MALYYTPKYVNPGEIVTANDLNKLENELARLWNYRGIISSSSDLPEDGEAGDFYLLVSDHQVQIHDGTQWNIKSMPVSIDWSDIIDKPGFFEQHPLNWLPRGSFIYFKGDISDLFSNTSFNGDDISVTGYGLAKSADGLLVSTIRKDEVPFSGVRSYAVEEGTTNLFTNPIFATGDESGFDVIYGWANRAIKEGGPFGRYIELEDNSDTGNAAYGIKINVSPGEWYTFSAYMCSLSNSGMVGLLFWWLDDSGAVIADYSSWEADPNYQPPNSWTRVSITQQAPENAVELKAVFYSTTANTGKSLVTAFQLEQKPFATSFVDGSRPNGSLQVLYDGAIRNLGSSGFVISAWYKIPYYDAAKAYKLFTTGEVYVGKNASGSWHLRVNDGGTIKTQNLLDQDVLGDGEWHYVVFMHLPNEKKAQVYIDGVLQAEITYDTSLYYDTSKYYTLAFGTDLDTSQNPPLSISPSNIYVQNIVVGLAYDSFGNIIWTQELIQKLAQWKNPFVVHKYYDEYLEALPIIVGSSMSVDVDVAVFDETVFGESSFGS